jgi:glycosyltransferase involved in cell wall biosynthesis
VNDTPERKALVDREMSEQQIDVRHRDAPGIAVYERGPITVYSVEDSARLRPVLHDQIREFNPDWILVSSEDLGHVLLREADASAPGRVVYIGHTPQFFPFGPASWNPDPHATEVIGRCAGVVAIGHHMAEYIRKYAGVEAAVIHPPIYGSGPFDRLGTFDSGFITIVNPCAVKGISIFLELARKHPELAFAALPGWGTTRADREALEAVPNVRLLPHCKHIDDCLRQTRILLMPSLWYEGFGLIAMEAMLRGIPVISSDSGGLKEAKKGTHYIIPVNPIEQYEPVFDDRRMPKPVLPPQDIAPWSAALTTLTTDRASYDREASDSQRAAVGFVDGLRAGQFEKYLSTLKPAAVAIAQKPDPSEFVGEAFGKLSPEKRELLLKLLKKQAAKRQD